MMSNFQNRNQGLRVHLVYTGFNLGHEKGVAISRNSLISQALQDGLGFKKMKSIEIFRNHKKLKNN